MVASLGCIGNPVYTELAEDELYVPGADLSDIADALDVIASANTELTVHAQGRRTQHSTE